MSKEAATRDIKLETIRRSVLACSKAKLPAIKEILIIECSKSWGTRRQSAQELLRELVSDESIVIDKEDVWSYDRWEKIKDSKEKSMILAKMTIESVFGYS